MDKLPTELLQAMLLPKDHRGEAPIYETSQLIPAPCGIRHFRECWKSTWIRRRVCRRFHEVLSPIALAGLKRELISRLVHMVRVSDINVHFHPRWRFIRDIYSYFVGLLESDSARLFPSSSTRRASFFYNVYIATGCPKQDWPVDERGVLSLEVRPWSQMEGEHLIFRAWRAGCWRWGGLDAKGIEILPHDWSWAKINQMMREIRFPSDAEEELHNIWRYARCFF